jgi:hypothetical protein
MLHVLLLFFVSLSCSKSPRELAETAKLENAVLTETARKAFLEQCGIVTQPASILELEESRERWRAEDNRMVAEEDCRLLLRSLKEIQFTCTKGKKYGGKEGSGNNRYFVYVLISGEIKEDEYYYNEIEDCGEQGTSAIGSATFIARILFEQGVVKSVLTDGAEKSAHADYARGVMKKVARIVQSRAYYWARDKRFYQSIDYDSKQREKNDAEAKNAI